MVPTRHVSNTSTVLWEDTITSPPTRSHSLPNLIDGVWPSHWSSLQPQQYVDYLHHPWTLDELFNSWKLVTKLKNSLLKASGRGERLEYLTWRIWIQRTHYLPKLHPYAIEWEKDASHLNAPGPLFRKIVSIIPTDIISTSRERATTRTLHTCNFSNIASPNECASLSVIPQRTAGCLKRQTMRDHLQRPLDQLSQMSNKSSTLPTQKRKMPLLKQIETSVQPPTPETILLFTSTDTHEKNVDNPREYSSGQNVVDSSARLQTSASLLLAQKSVPIHKWSHRHSTPTVVRFNDEEHNFSRVSKELPTSLVAAVLNTDSVKAFAPVVDLCIGSIANKNEPVLDYSSDIDQRPFLTVAQSGSVHVNESVSHKIEVNKNEVSLQPSNLLDKTLASLLHDLFVSPNDSVELDADGEVVNLTHILGVCDSDAVDSNSTTSNHGLQLFSSNCVESRSKSTLNLLSSESNLGISALSSNESHEFVSPTLQGTQFFGEPMCSSISLAEAFQNNSGKPGFEHQFKNAGVEVEHETDGKALDYSYLQNYVEIDECNSSHLQNRITSALNKLVDWVVDKSPFSFA